ncbi:MAG: superoxide dismutase [Porticoccaceae bacterium]
MKIHSMKHLLPPLAYEVSALEPHIDARTMILHHDKHHASYVEKLNLALESATQQLREKTAEWLLLNLSEVPDKIRTAVRNNAGGHVNHSLLWQAMSPQGGGAPSGPLADAIDDSFGNLAEFKSQFEKAGSELFGSGWVWLVKSHSDAKLRVVATSGHDNPLMQGDTPLLVNDVWEHAYYLKHENRRPEYLKNWWSIANWKNAEQRL